jgi:hypothetical protein
LYNDSCGIEPDFMTARGLTVELEAAQLQLPNDFPVSKSSQTAHSSRDHDRVVPPFTGSRQVRNAIALAPGIDQFSSDVARDLECLGNGPPLRYEARKFIRGRKEQAFRQFLDLYSNRQFHMIDPIIMKPSGRQVSRPAWRWCKAK